MENQPKRLWYPEHVSPEMLRRARELRRNQTAAEEVLWQRLRDRRIGYKFRRQQPLHSYIMDFYCAFAKLAIELDGSSHDGREKEDAYRQATLESQGVKVLRFKNEEVLHDTDRVVALIVREAGLRGDRQHCPSP